MKQLEDLLKLFGYKTVNQKGIQTWKTNTHDGALTAEVAFNDRQIEMEVINTSSKTLTKTTMLKSSWVISDGAVTRKSASFGGEDFLPGASDEEIASLFSRYAIQSNNQPTFVSMGPSKLFTKQSNNPNPSTSS